MKNPSGLLMRASLAVGCLVGVCPRWLSLNFGNIAMCRVRSLTLPAVLLVCSLVPVSRVWAEPLGAGLLGATEEQIAKKLGPPDAKKAESYKERFPEMLMVPAVRMAVYPWKAGKQIRFMAFGFDKDGIARNVQALAPELTEMSAFPSAIASGWTAEKDAAKVYPAVDKASPHVGAYINWQPSSGPIQWGTRFGKVDGIDHEGVFRTLTTSKGQEAYAMSEVYFWNRSGRPYQLRSVVVADADAFWAWTLDELGRQWKDGLPPPDPKKSTSATDRSYEYWLRSNFRDVVDERAIVAERMTLAIVAMVRNPRVDLNAARVPTLLVGARHDQSLSRQLLTAFQAAPNAGSLKERAATILSLLDDPATIEPMIRELRNAKPIPAAERVLKQFTAQDNGDDADRWQLWWQENRKDVLQAHEARQRERSSVCKVAHAEKGKLYHQPTPENGSYQTDRCPVLRKENSTNSVRLLTVGEARTAGWQPCPKCKPPR